MISSLLTIFIVGIVSIILLGIVLSLLGTMIGLAFFLLFKVAPILIIGYLVIRFLVPKKKASPEDEEWLKT
jgi:Na+-transporting methylmalonyl-CoA/oxaloacetate decarboxylase gamma subunit